MPPKTPADDDPWEMSPDIPKSPSKVRQEMETFLSKTEIDRLLHPAKVTYSKNILIAYPSFLGWLKFTDEIRHHGNVRGKVERYKLNKAGYENSLVKRLDDLKKFVTPAIVLGQIDRAKHSVTFVPETWNKPFDGSSTPVHDIAAATYKGEVARNGDGDPVEPAKKGSGQGDDVEIKLTPENFVPINLGKARPGFTPDETIIHELVHAMFQIDGKLMSVPVSRGFKTEAEFNAVVVADIYRSEKGFSDLLGSHDDDVVIDAADDFLGSKDIIPRPRYLLDRFKTAEPGVFRDIAAIPDSKAAFNPIRQYNDELKKNQAKAPAKSAPT